MRRAVFQGLREAYTGIEERVLCAVTGFCRTSMRYVLKGRPRDERIVVCKEILSV